MAKYMQMVNATTNVTAATEDTFLDISVPAGSQGRICEITISTESAASDSRAIIRVLRKSASGAGGISGTAVRRDPEARATGATVTIKNGTTAFGAGTVTDVLDRWDLNGRTTWRWVPPSWDSTMEWGLAAAAQIFGINVINNTASIVMTICVVWDE